MDAVAVCLPATPLASSTNWDAIIRVSGLLDLSITSPMEATLNTLLSERFCARLSHAASLGFLAAHASACLCKAIMA